MTVGIHKSTGNGTTGANVFGRSHGDKELTIAQGIIFCDGGGADENGWQSGTFTQPDEVGNCLRLLTQDSYAMRFITFAVDWTWGNDTIITRIDDAFIEAQTNCHFSDGSVHLFGASMGATCVLNWALANPTNVASIALVIPAVDIQDIDDNNRVTPYSLPEPKTAYGGSRPPDDHNPADNATDFLGMPMTIWYSNNDTICLPALTEAFGAAAGATMVNMGDQFPGGFAIPGHAATNLNPNSVAAFISEFDVAEHLRPVPKSLVTTAGRGQ